MVLSITWDPKCPKFIIQSMTLVSQPQVLEGEVVEFVVDGQAITVILDLESVV